MALIDTTTLLGIADRAAYQYMTIELALEDVKVEGGGFYFDRVTSTDDPDVEIPTEQSYKIVDDDFEVDMAIARGTRLTNIVSAMDAHFNVRDGGAPLQPGGWDGYLATKDERVSWFFAELFRVSKTFRMLAINVFSETEDVFADLDISGGPTLNFTDGLNYGNGADANPADGSNFAATQLRVKVVSMGGTDVDLRLSVKDKNDIPTTIDVTVPGSTAAGAFVDVGGTSDRFLDVIGTSFIPASSFGTLGDTFKIQNKKERQISL